MNSHKRMLLCLAVMLAAAGCSKKSPTEPSAQPTFNSVIQSGGEFDIVTGTSDTLSVDTTIQDVVGSEPFFCTRRSISATEAPDDFPTFDPNAEVVFPGNLLQGGSLDQATPDPIPVRRGPGTIVMIIDNGADSVSRTVPEMSLSNVFNAKNQIIANNPGILPARFSFTFEEVNSYEQLGLALDVSYSNLATEVTASLEFSTDREYNRFLVRLDQSFFSIAWQLPTSLAEVFDPSVTPAQLDPYIGPGNPAAFISSVTYGRKFYLLVESTASKTDIYGSIDASFSAAVSQGSIGGSVTYVSGLENVRIKAFALGGEQGAALRAITTDFDSLKAFIAQGGDIRTGVPLSYVVRSLSRPDQIVKVKIATEYDVVDCIPVGESVENPIVWFRADQGVTKTAGNLVSVWENFFDLSQFDAQPPTLAYGGQYVASALPGPNLPAIRFVPGGGSASNEGRLQFSGVNFVQTDFTIWAVAKLESQFSAYPEFFLFGSGATAGSNLLLGFRNSTQLTVSNQHDTLNLPTIVDQFRLYTIRFSQSTGLEVFVDGSLAPVASDPGMTQALVSFLGARIGSRNGNALSLAEFKAYGTAVTEIQRRALDEALLIRYGL